MKVGFLKKFILAIFLSVGALLAPQLASSAQAAESYLFFYEKDNASKIDQYVGSGNVGGLKPITGVHATGLPGNENKKIDFALESINKSTRTAKYKGTVTCEGNTFSLYAYVKIPDNFNNKNSLDGQIKYEGPGDGRRYRDCLPSNLGTDLVKSINLLNSTRGNNLEEFRQGYGGGSTDGGGSSSSDNDPEEEAKAECSAPGFGWAICGAINYIQDATEWVETRLIVPMFETKPLSFETNQDDNPLYAAWNATRSIANVFFVLVFIGVIFANLFGMEPYNVKKILPKLVVAAILIQTSYFFMAAAIDITNILGRGLREIMGSIMPDIKYTGNVSAGFVTLGAAAIIAAALAAKIAAVGIIAAALPLGIGIFAVMITLVLRQTLLVLAVLTAPIAIAAMVLPNTERLFRSWANLFIKLLLMFPLIILLFAAGRLAAFATLQNNTVLGPISPIVAMLCMALPLLAVPFTFSWAGGIMQKASSGVFKGGAKVQGMGDDKLKSWREDAKRRDTLRANPNLSFRNDGWKALNPRRRKQNWMAGGGFFYNSANAKRKIGESQEKYLGQDEKAYSRLYDNLVRNGQDGDTLLESIANGKAGSFGFKNDQGAVNFAVGKLAQKKKFDTIRTAKEGKNSTAVNAAISNSFSDIHKAAPDITVGNFNSIDTLGAAGLADLDHTTLSAYLDDQSVGVTAQVRADRADHIGKLVEDAYADEQLRNKFNNGNLLGVIHQRVNGGNGLGTHTQNIQNIVHQVTPPPQQGGPGSARFI